MTRGRLILGIIALLVVAFFGKQAVDALYFDARTELSSDIERYHGILDQFREERRDKYPPIEADLSEIVDRTFGHDRETVEAGLRARLNRLAEQCQLAESAVATGRHAVEESPAKRAMPRNPKRDHPDFAELEATISGTATLETSVRLIDAIENEPWIKRIDSISLDPRQGGSAFDVTVRLTTIYLPGRKPDPARVFPTYSGEEFGRMLAFVNANPFVKPERAVAVARESPSPPQPVPAPVPAPTFPYENWRITGVVHGSSGWEVWLLNAATQQSEALSIGQSVGDAVLVSASDEEAVFELGESRFLIRVGSTLGERMPVESGQESLR